MVKKIFINVDMDTLYDYSVFFNNKIDINNDFTLSATIPRFIELFEELNIKGTFFIIANQAIQNKKYIRQLYENGHEIANHTLNHLNNINRMDYKTKFKEINEADKILSDIIGNKIVGFRAPYYSIDNEMFRILNDLKYKYDSSILPTYLIPLIKFYTWLLVTRERSNKINLDTMFKSSEPYKIYNDFYEIPVSVTPITRFPFVGSYIQKLNNLYFNYCLKEIKLFKNTLNFELHAYEILSSSVDNIAEQFKMLLRIIDDLKVRKKFLFEKIKKIINNNKVILMKDYN